MTNGTIEFKYRKDSKHSYTVNGEFKFIANSQKVMVDDSYQQSGWVFYKYKITDAPKMYNFAWIYTKYSEHGLTEQMSAEIEYLKVTGLEYSAKQCLSCLSGMSQAGSDRCSLCEANEYLDKSINKCMKCDDGFYSLPGSVGSSSCLRMKPCSNSDIIT